jgi:hypothetical protein
MEIVDTVPMSDLRQKEALGPFVIYRSNDKIITPRILREHIEKPGSAPYQPLLLAN